MKLIVGLGNPGRAYSGSRHNIGSSVVKELKEKYRVAFKKNSLIHSLSAKTVIKNTTTILAAPLVFMNLSGVAVGELVKRYRINVSDLLIVCDDIDLGLGRLKIRPRGSCGGHNGLRSVIEYLGRQDFARLRIGIGRPEDKSCAMSEYVLDPFSKKEAFQVKEAVARAVSCCEVWINEGVSKSMDIFNRWSKNE